MHRTILTCLMAFVSLLTSGGRGESFAKPRPRFKASPFMYQKRESTQAHGKISGHITRNGKPALGLVVELLQNDTEFAPGSFVQATITGKDGEYHFDGLEAHHYRVRVQAPGFIGSDPTIYGSGRRVSVATGASVSGADIDLIRTATISGRITDIEGNPVQNEAVLLIDDLYFNAPAEPIYRDGMNHKTDSNGSFRIDEVPPGEYFVGIGEDIGRITGTVSYHGDLEGNRGQVESDHYYEQTFYPGVTDREQASKLSLVSGKELSGVDMIVQKPRQAYTVSGRIVDETTGKPEAGCLLQLYHRGARGAWAGGPPLAAPGTGPDGSFHFEGLVPGQFFLRASFIAGVNMYGDPLDFEVTDANVTGIELKVRPALKIAGSVVVEGIESAAGLAKLSGLKIVCTFDAGANGSSTSDVEMSPDGRFEVTGLAPGPVGLEVDPFCEGCEHFKFVRIDRPKQKKKAGPAEPMESIMPDDFGSVPLTVIDNLQGTRVVLKYCCTASIRCHVNLPPGNGSRFAGLFVLLSRKTGKSGSWCTGAEIDADGNVMIDSLEPGEYRINLQDNGRHIEGPEQRVLVEMGKLTTVVLNLGSKN
ncbi:MAG TPA: carboxypeptidase-like regulatory domain-containing protein [Blastocatellia bacterium]|nr:carboxypeptidase-like regulatory domain-containing protein [Blastocatellia bacterium]